MYHKISFLFRRQLRRGTIAMQANRQALDDEEHSVYASGDDDDDDDDDDEEYTPEGPEPSPVLSRRVQTEMQIQLLQQQKQIELLKQQIPRHQQQHQQEHQDQQHQQHHHQQQHQQHQQHHHHQQQHQLHHHHHQQQQQHQLHQQQQQQLGFPYQQPKQQYGENQEHNYDYYDEQQQMAQMLTYGGSSSLQHNYQHQSMQQQQQQQQDRYVPGMTRGQVDSALAELQMQGEQPYELLSESAQINLQQQHMQTLREQARQRSGMYRPQGFVDPYGGMGKNVNPYLFVSPHRPDQMPQQQQQQQQQQGCYRDNYNKFGDSYDQLQQQGGDQDLLRRGGAGLGGYQDQRTLHHSRYGAHGTGVHDGRGSQVRRGDQKRKHSASAQRKHSASAQQANAVKRKDRTLAYATPQHPR